ncbi:MAG TPA: hypothetical protein VGL06_22425 [Pseudonocardiaceae bacterium]
MVRHTAATALTTTSAPVSATRSSPVSLMDRSMTAESMSSGHHPGWSPERDTLSTR